jgi:hypothetical protein
MLRCLMDSTQQAGRVVVLICQDLNSEGVVDYVISHTGKDK